MTNPNNAIGTNGAFGGRTSVNAFNDGVASYSTGILSGWACEPSSGLTVILGGDGNTRDVAIAEDNAGNKTTINNISGSPVSVTVGAAPNSNSRIDSIVAYVNNPPTGTSTATDNYGACGLIVVAGTVSSNPSAPSESSIRAAITADGASGTTAYYVVLANITIPSGTTDLTSNNISQGSIAQIGAHNIDFATLSPLLAATSGSIDSPPSLTFTAPVDGTLLALAISGDNWGSDGVAYFNITTPSGLTSIVANPGITSNTHNGYSYQLTAINILSGAKAGVSYNFSVTKNGNFGQNCPLNLVVMLFPGSSS